MRTALVDELSFYQMRNVPVHPWALEGLDISHPFTVWLSGDDIQRLVNHGIPPIMASSMTENLLYDTWVTWYQDPQGVWRSVAWSERP